jgi:hypothetical protein
MLVAVLRFCSVNSLLSARRTCSLLLHCADQVIPSAEVAFRVSSCHRSPGTTLRRLVARFSLEHVSVLVLSYACTVIDSVDFAHFAALAPSLRVLDIAQWRRHHCSMCPLISDRPLQLDCAQLTALTRLESLAVGANVEALNIEALTALQSLGELSLRAEPSDDRSRPLAALTMLRKLRVHSLCNEDAALQALTALTDLSVHYTDALMPLCSLTALSNLRALSVTAKAGIFDLRELFDAAPRLRHFALDDVCDWRLLMALHDLSLVGTLRLDCLEFHWCDILTLQFRTLLLSAPARRIALRNCTLTVHRASEWHDEFTQLAHANNYRAHALSYIGLPCVASFISFADRVRISGDFIYTPPIDDRAPVQSAAADSPA